MATKFDLQGNPIPPNPVGRPRKIVKTAEEISDEEMIASFGESLFETFKEGNEPLSTVITKEGRRSKEYEDKKQRAKRLAELMAGLTPLQGRFVTHYVAKDWDTLSEVVIRAGSTSSSPEGLRQIAWNYLQRKDIKEAIGLMTLRKLEAEGIDRFEILGMLRDSFNGAMADGKYKEANEAATLLGTSIGVFAPTKSKDLSKTDMKQLGELNQVARKHNLHGGDYSSVPDANPIVDEMTLEDLNRQLSIASPGKAH